MTSNDASAPRLAALRYRDFRLLWFGQIVAVTGAQMQLLAVNWHVYELLKGEHVTLSLFGRAFDLDAEALGLGALGLARVLPVMLFAMIGGALADTRDRRGVMIWTQSAALLVAAALAVVSFSGHASVAVLFLLTTIGAATSAFDMPARQAIIPQLVRPEHLTNAISLNTLVWQIGTIIGPGIAGVLIARFDIGLVYVVDALSIVAVLAALLLMRYRGSPGANAGGEATRAVSLAAIVEGFRFTYGSRLIWSTMLLDFFATFFSSARTMLPIVAGQVLGVGPGGYGLLATAQPVGALAAGVIVSLRREIRRQGVVLLLSVVVYGLATALFGVSTVFALSYVLFALTGASDTVSTVIRGTIRQIHTPDHLRGRMVGVNMMFFMGGPQLGELEAGLVAAAFGAPFAIASGGVATVLLTAWIAWKYPRLRTYSVRTPAEAAATIGAD